MKRNYNYINGTLKRIEALKILAEKEKESNEIKDLILKCKENKFRSTQTLYHVLHNDFDLSLGICSYCKTKRTSFRGDHIGYDKFCSLKCHGKDMKITYPKKFGSFPFQRAAIRKKAAETIFKKYNVRNVSEHPEIKNLKIRNAQKKYGEHITSPMQLPEIKEKVRNTNLKKFGVPANFYVLENRIKFEENRRLSNIKRKFKNLDKVTEHELEIIELIEQKSWWKKMLFELGLTPEEISEFTGLKLYVVKNKIKILNLYENNNIENKENEFDTQYHEELFKPF